MMTSALKRDVLPIQPIHFPTCSPVLLWYLKVLARVFRYFSNFMLYICSQIYQWTELVYWTGFLEPLAIILYTVPHIYSFAWCVSLGLLCRDACASQSRRRDYRKVVLHSSLFGTEQEIEAERFHIRVRSPLYSNLSRKILQRRRLSLAFLYYCALLVAFLFSWTVTFIYSAELYSTAILFSCIFAHLSSLRCRITSLSQGVHRSQICFS
jgi:hypothetical protein